MKFLSGITYIFLIVLLISSCSRPMAEFAYERTEDMAPSKVTFKNESKNATEYMWDFGDGNTSTEVSPSHRYVHSGNYEITLIAKDEKGKQNIEKSRLMVKPPKNCVVEIETTFGKMVVELFDDTPKHRDNFFKLADEGFYDGILFHRVISGFMVQGGDPGSRQEEPGQLGGGGPGYKIPAEIDNDHVHVKGALAAARQGDGVNPMRESSGSQFYIVQGKPISEKELNNMARRNGWEYTEEQKKAYMENGGTPFLDGSYTVFGRVISGMDVIDKIAATKTRPGDRPIEDVVMKMTAIK